MIHSGLYYKPDSLKARLCVRGNELMYDFAHKYNVNYNNCGKLIVIPTIEELPKLEELMKNGMKNGVDGLQMISGNSVMLAKPINSLFRHMPGPLVAQTARLPTKLAPKAMPIAAISSSA